MATTNTNPNFTPGEVKDGEDVPSNLDAARPVIDRAKDVQAAAGAVSGGDAVIDNSPESAAAAEQAEADAKATADEEAKADKAEAAAREGAKTQAAKASTTSAKERK